MLPNNHPVRHGLRQATQRLAELRLGIATDMSQASLGDNQSAFLQSQRQLHEADALAQQLRQLALRLPPT